MQNVITCINAIVWGIPALTLILAVGLYLTVRLRFAQLTLFPRAIRLFIAQLRPSRKSRDGTSSFQALCTALAATVGTGNLVGVAGAICLGGPGAIFWMWVCGILGMITKYAEAALAVRYRIRTSDGYAAGPMYIITRGLPAGFHFLAYAYALFGVVAAFGVGNAAQVNAVISGMDSVLALYGREVTQSGNLLIGVILAVVIGILLLGGARRIGAAAERLVPFAAAGYILMCIGVLFCCRRNIPGAFLQILQGAFSPRAVTGGMLGSSFQALRIGCSRGVFTNEAGMGTAGIAHGSAQAVHPARQGLMGMVEVFLDTILICTLTALVILTSGVAIPFGTEAGEALTVKAFSSVYGPSAVIWLACALTLFAVATVLGWSLYGARCAEFLFGCKAWRWFSLLQILAVVITSQMETATVWQLSEAVNGLMAIPNLIALAVLTPEVARLTKEYKNRHRPVEVQYADFHQRKPL